MGKISMNEFYKEKFEKIFCKDWSIKFNENLYNENPEFFDSLEVLSFEEDLLWERRKIEKMLAFFKDMVGIEMLLRETYKEEFIGDIVSRRYAHLLGEGIYQRYRIQNHLGTLYSVRNSIFHQLNINLIKKSEDFKRFFNEDFDSALKTLNLYHKLLLLRLITHQNDIISKKNIITEMSKFDKDYSEEINSSIDYRRKIKQLTLLDIRLNKNLQLPDSQYKDEIDQEIINITKIEPEKYFEDYLNKKSKINCYFLGINTYGGLTEITHSQIGNPDLFYKENSRIIPNLDVWKNLSANIDNELKFIFENEFSEVILFLKAHHSLLLYFGYQLYNCKQVYKNSNLTFQCYIVNQFKNQIEEFPLDFNYQKHRILCSVKTNISKESEKVLVTINIRHDLFDEYLVQLKSLNLHKLPRITYSYIFKNSERLITYTNNFKQFCKEIEIDLNKRKEIKTIHLIVKIPEVMMILLGEIFSKLKIKVILYEFGSKNINDNPNYHQVIEINPNKIREVL